MSPHLTRDIKPQQTGLTFRDRHRWGGRWRGASHYAGSGGTTSPGWWDLGLQEACLPGPSPGPLQRKQLDGRGLPVGRLAGWSEVWRPLPWRWLSHWAGAPTGSIQGCPDWQVASQSHHEPRMALGQPPWLPPPGHPGEQRGGSRNL